MLFSHASLVVYTSRRADFDAKRELVILELLRKLPDFSVRDLRNASRSTAKRVNRDVVRDCHDVYGVGGT